MHIFENVSYTFPPITLYMTLQAVKCSLLNLMHFQFIYFFRVHHEHLCSINFILSKLNETLYHIFTTLQNAYPENL